MAKKKTFISITPEVAERIRNFQTQHSISYFSSCVEMLTMMGLEKMDLMVELEESRRLNMEISRYTLAILASISQHANIPVEIKQAGRSSAEQMLTKAVNASKNPEQGGE
jgi:hypothetical protein